MVAQSQVGNEEGLGMADVRPAVLLSLDDWARRTSLESLRQIVRVQHDLGKEVVENQLAGKRNSVEPWQEGDVFSVDPSGESTRHASRIRHLYDPVVVALQDLEDPNLIREQFLQGELLSFAERIKLEVEIACTHAINPEYREEPLRPLIIVNATAWEPVSQALFWLLPELLAGILTVPFRVLGVMRGTHYEMPDLEKNDQTQRVRDVRLFSLLCEGEAIWGHQRPAGWLDPLCDGIGKRSEEGQLPRGYDRLFLLDSMKMNGKWPSRIKMNEGESNQQIMQLLEALVSSNLDFTMEEKYSRDVKFDFSSYGFCGFGGCLIEAVGYVSSSRDHQVAELIHEKYLKSSEKGDVDQLDSDLVASTKESVAVEIKELVEGYFQKHHVDGFEMGGGDNYVFLPLTVFNQKN